MQENKELLAKIREAIEHGGGADACEDYFSALRHCERQEQAENCLWLRKYAEDKVREGVEVERFFYLAKRTYLLMAPYDFDSYLIYLEWDRPVEERFYQPRRKIMRRVADALQRLTDGELDELFLSMPPRVGKALADDTPILTRNGWKNHGDLCVGDEVIGMNGEFKKVVAVHPKCQLDVLVEFTNGEKIQCHENHEWRFYDRATGKEHLEETKVWEKRSLEYGRERGKRGHRYVLQLPTREPIVGEHKELFDPYTLGVWLGDGSNQNCTIVNALCDKAMIDKIERNGNRVSWKTVHKTTGVWHYGFLFRKELQKYGMCFSKKRTEKHIPEEYLTASKEQRLELLAGLIDTDGTLRRNEHRYDYTTCDLQLLDSFIQLISTFGWRCCVAKYEPTVSSSGVVGRKPYYTISFNPDMEIPCVLERKQLREFSKQRKVAVKSIRRVEPKQGNCITVEGDGMYLAGRTLVPTHNTSMLMFYCTWLVGRNSEKSNLYSAFSDIITSAFYSGCLEVINDPVTYLWHDVFPEAKIVSTNAKDETFNVNRVKRYPSLTCRSLYGTLNGACDCNGVLISDDLIGGIEEALNKDRLISAWSKVDNNLIPRAKETAKVLWCGTRWSVADPAGLRMELLQTDERFANRRFEIINLPALDENEESNFEYQFNVGFSTEYYKQRRASFEKNNDMPSWDAQYMGQPVERSGVLFEPDSLRTYNGVLPDGEPDRVFMCVDPAFGGGDFVAAPVCVQYGDDVFIPSVVYSDGDKKITQPLIVQAAKEYKPRTIRMEANRSTMDYAEKVGAMLKENNVRASVVTKPAPNNKAKEIRIYDAAPDIREHFIFLEPSKRPKHYEQFMQNVYSFKLSGNNKHDDAPDSLAAASDELFKTTYSVKVGKRAF